MNVILVTGGCGFIGSNFFRYILSKYLQYQIINLDKLTYTGNLEYLKDIAKSENYFFVHGDIGDKTLVNEIFLGTYRINGKRLPSPNMVVNFAAESHVDRSILGPVEFIKSNIHGTFCLLEAAKGNWQLFPGYMASKPAAHGNNHTSYQSEKPICRFLHVSTDEVYGSLSDTQAFSVRLRNMIPAAPIQPPKQPQII